MNKLISLLCITILISVNTFGQKIFSDKKDPFTNERNIITTNITLTPILQVGAMAQINDTSKRYILSFIIKAIPGLKVQTADSSKNECLLKTVEGQIITGKYYGSAQVPIGFKLYHSFSYTFKEADFKALSISELTDIKFEQGLFEIKKKNQFSKLCSLLITQ